MKYSLVIPTYNRLEELKEFVASLEGALKGDYEIELIIVDDGSTDQSKEFLKGRKFDFDFLYLCQENKGPGPARNYGMSMANGDYILFIDSDCTFPPDYFLKIDIFLKQSKVDAFGGPDTYREDFAPLLKAINYSMTSFIGTGGTRGSSKSISKYYPRSFNMGIHRDVYKRIGDFGILRHGQDMDYSARIYEAGFKVALIPDAFVYHKRRTSVFKFFKQIHNWGVARVNLGSLHPRLLKPVHFAPSLILVLTILLPVFSFFVTIGLEMIVGLLFAGFLVAAFAFFQSLFIYKNLSVALLSIVTLFIQVFAYGMGFLNGLFQKHFLGKKVAIGITKNYYGNKNTST